MKQPDISVIIPTIGRRTLVTVLERIQVSQQFAPQISAEIIVVCDDDISVSLPENVQIEKTPKKRSGAATARNIGVQKSSGRIIIFLGDDIFVSSHFLQQTFDFHENTAENFALIGKIDWVPVLKKNPFCAWLSAHAQFDFSALDNKKKPDWRHAYTAQISLKKSFAQREIFDEDFSGWGFEDSEWAYRLEKNHGLRIYYDKNLVVLHDHFQTEEALVEKTKSAARNAEIFERKHPEFPLKPRGVKLLTLQTLIFFAQIFSRFSPKIRWWYLWKKAWIEG